MCIHGISFPEVFLTCTIDTLGNNRIDDVAVLIARTLGLIAN